MAEKRDVQANYTSLKWCVHVLVSTVATVGVINRHTDTHTDTHTRTHTHTHTHTHTDTQTHTHACTFTVRGRGRSTDRQLPHLR